MAKCLTSVSHIRQQAGALDGVTYAGCKVGCRAEPAVDALCLAWRSLDQRLFACIPGDGLATGELMGGESQGGMSTA